MIKILFSLSFIFFCQLGNAQNIGEIREVKLVLEDLPFSGDAIQANFISEDSSEIFSFNHMVWLDKHVSLLNFFHTYRDSCLIQSYHFSATLIYIPLEEYNYVRYEGYLPTGKMANTWVLTSILKEENDY